MKFKGYPRTWVGIQWLWTATAIWALGWACYDFIWDDTWVGFVFGFIQLTLFTFCVVGWRRAQEGRLFEAELKKARTYTLEHEPTILETGAVVCSCGFQTRQFHPDYALIVWGQHFAEHSPIPVRFAPDWYEK